MNCPNCESEMVQIFSEWVCEDCQTRNQTYYTSKNLPRSLFNFLGFPKPLKEQNMITQDTIIPSNGNYITWSFVTIIPYPIENIKSKQIETTCDIMYNKGWTWKWELVHLEGHQDKTYIKICIDKEKNSDGFLPPNTKFTTTIKFKLEA